MTPQQSGRLTDEAGTNPRAWRQEMGARSKEQPVQTAKNRSASAKSTRDHKLMLQQEILGQEGLGSSRREKHAQAARQWKKKEQDMRHS